MANSTESGSIAPCRHFGLCGGCSYQDVPYPAQLAAKESRCRELLAPFLQGISCAPIVGSPSPFYYRNKMEFTFGFTGEGLPALGLHCRDNPRNVFPLEECPIFSRRLERILPAVSDFVAGLDREPYRIRGHTGFWRNLVVRETKFTGQVLVNLVTVSAPELDVAPLVRVLEAALPGEGLSVIHTLSDSPSNAVIPDKVIRLLGPGELEEEIDGRTFHIPPFSFFQVNPSAIRLFYRCLGEIPALSGHEEVLDLYCGTGPLGVVLAGMAGGVTGIELDPAAVATARINCRLNGVSNADYVVGDARKVLLEHRQHWRGRFGLVAVNPPRSGLSKKVIKRILELEPGVILYSSCNPNTFAPQAELLLESYRLEYVRPFDFFPHTPHLELLAVFARR